MPGRPATTRGLVFAGINKTPPSVPSDRLVSVLSHAQNDFQRLVMVLVCVHALSGTDIRRLLLTDLDLSRERLISLPRAVNSGRSAQVVMVISSISGTQSQRARGLIGRPPIFPLRSCACASAERVTADSCSTH